MAELAQAGAYLPVGRRGFDNANMLMFALAVSQRFCYCAIEVRMAPRFLTGMPGSTSDAEDRVGRILTQRLAAEDTRGMLSLSDSVRHLMWVDSVTLDRPDDPAHVLQFHRSGRVCLSAACDLEEVNTLLSSCIDKNSLRGRAVRRDTRAGEHSVPNGQLIDLRTG